MVQKPRKMFYRLKAFLYSIVHKIGGNFGLFTGMSILSMFEIAFWLVRFILGTSGTRKISVGTPSNISKTKGKKRLDLRLGIQGKKDAIFK